MLRFGEQWSADEDKNTFEAIVSYIMDEIREELHMELCPCTAETFLNVYLQRDPKFAELLKGEFGIEI